ncbi:MAG: hypothetical protein IT379_13705, partial [Deltaproteobacteria bacterium]|nr:hypothetical protein [Deltaproteobacteria bacterium]
MRNLGVVLAICGAVSASGCSFKWQEWDDGTYQDGYVDSVDVAGQSGRWTPPAEYVWENRIDVFDAHQSGELGQVRYQDDIVLVSAQAPEGVAVVSVYSGYESWGVMNQISILGGLDHEDLVDGAVLRFDGLGYTADSSLQVTVLGCSGVRPNTWDVDQNAASVEVRVTPSAVPGRRALHYSATFDSHYGT